MKKEEKKIVVEKNTKTREESIRIMMNAINRLNNTLDKWKKSNEIK